MRFLRQEHLNLRSEEAELEEQVERLGAAAKAATAASVDVVGAMMRLDVNCRPRGTS